MFNYKITKITQITYMLAIAKIPFKLAIAFLLLLLDIS